MLNKKLYDYGNRIIVQFSDGKRASYSQKLYEGTLLKLVANLSFEEDRKIENYYLKKDNLVKIYLRENIFTTIDENDFERVRDVHWSINANGYAHSRQNGEKKYLHRVISDYNDSQFPEEIVDHINNIRLDNRKENLRIVTRRENATNLSGQEFMGVGPIHNGFRARWSSNRKNFEKYFSGENAENKAREYRLQKMKETGYLRTFND